MPDEHGASYPDHGLLFLPHVGGPPNANKANKSLFERFFHPHGCFFALLEQPRRFLPVAELRRKSWAGQTNAKKKSSLNVIGLAMGSYVAICKM